MKTEIANRRKEIQLSISQARRHLNKAIKDKRGAEANRQESEIVRLERLRSFYASGVAPIQFSNGFVINGKLLEQFTKKLKGISLAASFIDENQMLEFTHENGKLTMFDLRDYYKGLSLPKAEVFLDELGINIS